MEERRALITTVDQLSGLATVTVCGGFGLSSFALFRDRLAWVAEHCPQRLVLDLGASDRFAEQLITLIAAARRELRASCLLEIRSASPAVRDLLEPAASQAVNPPI